MTSVYQSVGCVYVLPCIFVWTVLQSTSVIRNFQYDRLITMHSLYRYVMEPGIYEKIVKLLAVKPIPLNAKVYYNIPHDVCYK